MYKFIMFRFPVLDVSEDFSVSIDIASFDDVDSLGN